MEPFLSGSMASEAEVLSFLPMLKEFHVAGDGFAQRPSFLTAVEMIDATRSADIDLAAMPDALVRKCRDAWRNLLDAQPTIIHADFCAGNILVLPDHAPALIDWDECRVDLAVFDLPGGGETSVAKARFAWEIAVCWSVEPNRAMTLASLF